MDTAALHNGWPPPPHQPWQPPALPTISWMPWTMALCQVLMMASESCWIRYSEPSRPGLVGHKSLSHLWFLGLPQG